MSLKYLQDHTKWFINIAGKIGVKTFMKYELFSAMNRCLEKNQIKITQFSLFLKNNTYLLRVYFVRQGNCDIFLLHVHCIGDQTHHLDRQK